MHPFRSLVLAFTFVIAAPVAAQDLTAAEQAQVDKIVTSQLAATGTPSASIAVVRGGRIVFARAYGKASETMPVASPTLPYQIASISKQFTGAALLLLAEDGKLSLDDMVSKYVPGITEGDHITIRQLLSHTSGLQDYWPQDYSFKAMATPITPQGIVDRWAKKPLDFAPGTQWQYSNTGYVVAGMIVEKVAGQPLLAFLQQRVFKPLGITAYDQDLAVGPRFPQGYGRHALGPLRVEPPAAQGWLFAAGELSMSASDLAKWDIARIDRTILAPVDWQAQETPVKLSDGSNSRYGLGVFVGSQDGRKMIEHSGEAVGFISENLVFPDDKAAFVVLTNTWSSGAASGIATALSKTLLPPAPANMADLAAGKRARALFDLLRNGQIDRAELTDDANFYFTPTAIADFKSSLGPLGTPDSFTQAGPVRLRGGFVLRSYRLAYKEKTLILSTFLEPGDQGRFEQFLISPAN